MLLHPQEHTANVQAYGNALNESGLEAGFGNKHLTSHIHGTPPKDTLQNTLEKHQQGCFKYTCCQTADSILFDTVVLN